MIQNSWQYIACFVRESTSVVHKVSILTSIRSYEHKPVDVVYL